MLCLLGGADDNLIEGGEMKFVCKPGARNITVIFQPLLRYELRGHIQSVVLLLLASYLYSTFNASE